MSLLLELKINPGSGKQQFVLDKKNNSLKCFLKSPPEKGKANNELIKFLSKKLKTSQENLIIIKGLTSRKKVLKINLNINYQDLLKKIL